MAGELQPDVKIPGLPPKEKAAAEGADPNSESEADLLGSGLEEQEIRRRAAHDDYNRGKKFKDNFELIAIIAMWVIAAVLLVVGLTWLWHLLTPLCLHWLDEDQVDTLQNILAGGVLISVF